MSIIKNKEESLEDFFERHCVEILFAFMLSFLVCDILIFQLVISGKDNSLFIYLGLCFGEVGLAIMINKGMLKNFLAQWKKEQEDKNK